jgi:hypothetical protein
MTFHHRDVPAFDWKDDFRKLRDIVRASFHELEMMHIPGMLLELLPVRKDDATATVASFERRFRVPQSIVSADVVKGRFHVYVTAINQSTF